MQWQRILITLKLCALPALLIATVLWPAPGPAEGDAGKDLVPKATIPVGDHPYGVAVNADTNLIYVANGHSDNVSVIDGAANGELKRIAVGNHPYGVAVNSATNKVYVANYFDASVSVVDGATNEEIDTDGNPDNGVTRIPVVNEPTWVAVNPTTNRIYVLNWQPIHSVSVIDGATDTEIDTDDDPGNGITPIPLQDFPGTLAVNSATNQIYVTLQPNGPVVVIDGASNSIKKKFDVGTKPGAVAVNGLTNRVYVGRQLEDIVLVFDAATNDQIGDPIGVGDEPTQVAVNPATNRVYVVNYSDETLSVINGKTNTVVDTVSVQQAPASVGVNIVTNKAYVVNQNSNTVSVIVDPGDTDGDGCTDDRELQPKSEASQGGGRDPKNPWDFFDAAGPYVGPPHSWPPDQYIDLVNDILGVILKYQQRPEDTTTVSGQHDIGVSLLNVASVPALNPRQNGIYAGDVIVIDPDGANEELVKVMGIDGNELSLSLPTTKKHVAGETVRAYLSSYDRGPSAGPNPWNMTAPDGTIDLFNDILGVILQYQHDCRA